MPYTRQELTDLLNSKGYTNSGIVAVSTKTSPTGNVVSITFTDSSGKTFTRTKEACRTFLGLRSQRYTISGGSTSGEGTAYYVNKGDTLPTLNGAYAINGSGGVSPIAGQVYAIDGSGAVAPVTGGTASAGTTSTGNVFTFTGSGWGHSVGMSQWGANAMAHSGYTYRDILQFYYTGIEVRQP